MEIMERDLKKNGRMYEQSIELHMNNQPNILVIKKKTIKHTVYKHPGISTNCSMIPETGTWKRW